MSSGRCLVPGSHAHGSNATREGSDSTCTHPKRSQKRPLSTHHIQGKSTNPDSSEVTTPRNHHNIKTPIDHTVLTPRRGYCVVHFISYMPPTCLALPMVMVSQSNKKKRRETTSRDAEGRNRHEVSVNQPSLPANQTTNQPSQPKAASKQASKKDHRAMLSKDYARIYLWRINQGSM